LIVSSRISAIQSEDWNGAKRLNVCNGLNKSLQRFSTGSNPLLVMAPDASGEARNLISV
jgi:hypothetical protein